MYPLALNMFQPVQIIEYYEKTTYESRKKCQKIHKNTHKPAWLLDLPIFPHVSACHLMSLNGSKWQFIGQ